MISLRKRIRQRFPRHHTMIKVMALMFLGATLAVAFSYYYSSQTIRQNYTRTFEQQNWGELNTIYGERQTAYRSFFESTLSTIHNLVTFPSLSTALAQHNRGVVQSILDQQVNVGTQFDSVSIFNAKGDMLYISSKNPGAQQHVGENYGYRDYIENASLLARPFYGQAFVAQSGNILFNFTDSLRDTSGNIQYIISGYDSLESLAKKVNLPPHDQDYKSSLVDLQGNLLLENGQGPKTIVNVSGSDNLVGNVLRNSKELQADEVNYKGTRVLAHGSILHQDNKSGIALFMYYPRSLFDAQVSVLDQQVQQLYVRLVARDIVIILILYIILAWLFRRHDLSE